MTGRASISGVVLTLAVLASLLVATPAQAAAGTLRGTLKGPDGAPFDFFKVELYQPDGSGDWTLVHSRDFLADQPGEQVGSFELTVPPGTYRACFRTRYTTDYEWAEAVGIGCWKAAFDVRNGLDVIIADGGTTTISPRLPAEGAVQGTVTGPGGAPIPSGYVVPYRLAPDGTWTWTYGDSVAADGTFSIGDLDPGTYRFCVVEVPREYVAECWRDAPDLAAATDLLVRPGGAPTIAFSLARRASVSGTVTVPAGVDPFVNVGIHRWNNQRWEALSYTQTDAAGHFRIGGLDAGTYRLCTNSYQTVVTCWRTGDTPAEADDLVLVPGQQRANVNFAPTVAGEITGTLPEMYLGAEGYPVVTAWLQTATGWEPVTTGDAVPTGIGNDWDYSIGSLPTGTYVACVEHQDPEFVPAFPRTCTGGSPTPQGGEPFEVVAGETTSGIDIVTDRAGEIRGRVNGATSPVRVDLYTAAGRLAVSRQTAPDGTYRFAELPDGTYYVGFHRATATSPLAAEWWQNKQDPVGLAGASPIAVDGAIVTGIAALLDTGGVITGRLVDTGGDPVAGCILQARGRGGTLAIRRGVTDANGEFAIRGLSTSPYVVLVSQACSGAPTALYFDAASPTYTSARLRDADDVAVTRGATTDLPFELVVGVS